VREMLEEKDEEAIKNKMKEVKVETQDIP